ncbi:MAG: hypothetical protein IJQ93_07930 [Bacteroidales bacterium]|nr:hypothetical protein [Clostridia bacterium]MBR0205617.1 hypothetical protein [Clostridia bacterium]MBR0300227.1 hypothetical protein [Bacteroidales bacterium]
MSKEPIIYRLNDDISFRKCSLIDGKLEKYGDCTEFYETQENFVTFYTCKDNGIHLHCTKHPAIELDYVPDGYDSYLQCRCCKNEIRVKSKDEIIRKCLKQLNMEIFKNAKLIRLDDWYTAEVKEPTIKTESGYWVKTDVKTDRDGDTIVVIYIGHKDSSQKAQYFIKPEKHQLTCDHKDMDPAKIISKIEVTLRDRFLTQQYDYNGESNDQL